MTEHLLTWIALDESKVDEATRRSLIPVMPAGTFKHPAAGGTFEITEADLHAYAEDLNARGDRIAIDYDHSFFYGRGSRAAGWFLPGTARVENGTLYAEVEWTPPAHEAIRNGEYRFISPEFTFKLKKVGNKARIVADKIKAAALTNRPFFDQMEPVMIADRGLSELLAPDMFLIETAQLEAANERFGEDVTRALIASAQSLGEAAQLARNVLSSIQPDKEKSMSEKHDLAPLAEAIGIAADATLEELAAAYKAVAEERDALKLKVEDLEKKVPTDEAMRSLIASAQKGEEAANKLAELTKKNVLDEAVRQRKFAPAQRSYFESMYDIDPEGVTKLLAEMPSGSFAAIGSGEGEGEFGPENEPGFVTIQGSQYAIDPDSHRIHEEALKILADAGKAPDDADAYVMAATQAATKLGLKL